MGIWIAGCQNVTLTGLTVAESGGDGLYVDDMNHGQPDHHAISRDIHVRTVSGHSSPIHPSSLPCF